MASSKKRSYRTLTTLIVLAGAGGVFVLAAREAANYIERQSRAEVQTALNIAGQEWVEVNSDGLQVVLSGEAPNEIERFRAVTEAGAAIDPRRIVDQTTLAKQAAIEPPDFKVELLRNDQGISMIGLVPAKTDREALVNRLSRETAAPKVTDLLETADYPVPDNWDETIEFGLRAAQLMPHAKISIEPGDIQITALAESRTEQGELEAKLINLLPENVSLDTEISAPRPVVSPFTLRFSIDEKGPKFAACVADKTEGRDRIVKAAELAGVKDPACVLALGSPTPDWADAGVAAVNAVAAMGQGNVAISDADVTLFAPSSVEQAVFNKAVDDLQKALPDVFTLEAELERPEPIDKGPAEFTATMTADRAISMRGRSTNQQMREAVNSFAQSQFSQVEGKLRDDETTPGGWTVKTIAGLEAVGALDRGNVTVTPDLVKVSGVSGDPREPQHVASVLAARLGAGTRYELSIRYDRRLDPALNLPSGNECVDRLNIIMSESVIGFEPNKSAIAGDPSKTLARMAEAFKDCGEYQIEAGGHTDAQGSEGFNADLSRSRAQALVKAMNEAGIDTRHMTSRGYGESQPIMSNDSETGREANRRIEFRLLSPNPVRTEPLPAPVTVKGITGAGEKTAKPASMQQMRGTPPVSEPVTERTPQATPATLGASEEIQPLDERDENLRLPVQTPDENTQYPKPRPESIKAENQDETQQSKAETE